MASADAPTVIGYHYPCPDGVCAALAATLGLTGGLPAAAARGLRYLPLRVTDSVDARIEQLQASLGGGRARAIYLLDFSGGLAFLRACAAAAAAVYLLDHHATAAADLAAAGGADGGEPLPPNLHATLRMERCGTTVTGEYFGLLRDGVATEALAAATGGADAAARVSRLFAYIEDHDLWRHALPLSREFSAGLNDLDLEYNVNANPAVLDALLALDVDRTIERGKEAKARMEAIVRSEAATAFPVAIPYGPGGRDLFRCLAVVSAHPEYRSTLGHEVAAASAAAGLLPAGVVAYMDPGLSPEVAATSIKLSFRSMGSDVEGEAAVDTTVVTRHYGGGGHRGASSCIIPRRVFDSWRTAAAGVASGDARAP